MTREKNQEMRGGPEADQKQLGTEVSNFPENTQHLLALFLQEACLNYLWWVGGPSPSTLGTGSGVWTGAGGLCVGEAREGEAPHGEEAALMSHCCPGAALLGAAHLWLRFIMWFLQRIVEWWARAGCTSSQEVIGSLPIAQCHPSGSSSWRAGCWTCTSIPLGNGVNCKAQSIHMWDFTHVLVYAVPGVHKGHVRMNGSACPCPRGTWDILCGTVVL